VPEQGGTERQALGSHSVAPGRQHADGGHRHRHRRAGEPAEGRQPWHQCELPHHLTARAHEHEHDHHHDRHHRHPVDHGGNLWRRRGRLGIAPVVAILAEN
jgi:hypothetical protein